MGVAPSELPPAEVTERTNVAPSSMDLTATVNLVGVGVSHLSLHERVVWANPFYCEFLGYTLEELQALSIRATTHPDDAQQQVEMIRRLRDGEARVATWEKRFVRKDGTERWGRLTASLVRDEEGRPSHYVAVTADIAELKAAERELVRNQRLLEDAEALARIGSWERELGTGALSWSAGGYRMFALDPTKTTLTFELFMSMVHEDDRARLAHTLKTAFDQRSEFEIEYRVHRQDGELRILHVRGRLFRDADGKPTRTIGTMQDVTEVRRQEQTIREQQQALTHSEALAAIGSLAASVGHEINNPLAYVMLNLETVGGLLPGTEARLTALMESPAAPEGGEGIRELIEDVRATRGRIEEALDGVRRIGAMVKTLKGLPRLEAHENTAVDPIRSIETALTMAANGIHHQARLVRDYEPVARVLGEDVRLAQVFLNLLVNASGAIEERGPGEHEIRIIVRQHPGEVTVSVRDTGCGIPKENLARIFEPFFSTKSRKMGTGLGLPISRKIIEEMGGRIEVTSEPGAGATFTVHLCVADGERTLVAPLDEEAPSREAPITLVRVLVVDDEPMIRKAVGRSLRNCVVVEAASGDAARELLSQDRAFDLILCDMMMPRTSGMDLHGWLAVECPELVGRLVFITGGAFSAASQDFLQRNDVRLLEKPFTAAALERLVREIVSAAPLASHGDLGRDPSTGTA